MEGINAKLDGGIVLNTSWKWLSFRAKRSKVKVSKVKFQLLLLCTLLVGLGLLKFTFAPTGPWNICMLVGDLQSTLTLKIGRGQTKVQLSNKYSEKLHSYLECTQ